MNEIDLIYTSVLGCSRTDLYLEQKTLRAQDEIRIRHILSERQKGLPLQYLIGSVEFMGLEFRVNRNVFIPRPETEILVEKTIELLANQTSNKEPSRILDIGTGSGCIGISLVKFLAGKAKVDALDISIGALEIAKVNAELNNVSVNFVQSDLFEGCPFKYNTHDMIVSNPPYIATCEIEFLQPEVCHEPRIALDGGIDGLDFYRKIVAGCRGYLRSGGFLVMETGFGQYPEIKRILEESNKFRIIESVKDYNKIDRVVIAQIA